MLYPQTRVTPDEIRDRLRIVRMYVALTRTMHSMAFPKTEKPFGAEVETLLVLTCVFIGDAEGRPTSASKIASHAGLPRASVYRRLELLTKMKKIVREGRNYHFAKDAVTPDPYRRLGRILDKYLTN